MYSIPLACLFTFSPYGVWLHGDERRSVDAGHNAYGTPHAPPDARLLERRRAAMKHDPVYLDAHRRTVIGEAIGQSAHNRGWTVGALNARTNHVHAVIAISDSDPHRVLTALKGNVTRAMRGAGCWTAAHSPWAEGGSKRYLWKARDVEAAVRYVADGQGDDLPGGQSPER